jgi:hypothetical protein
MRSTAADVVAVVDRRLRIGALGSLAGGLAVLAYRGPGVRFVRGTLGDVAATVFLYCLLGMAWKGRVAVRAAAVLALGVAVEAAQALHWVTARSSTAVQLVFGATFDPWDVLAYAAGVAIAIALECLGRYEARGADRTGR